MPRLLETTYDRYDRTYAVVLAEALARFQCGVAEIEGARWDRLVCARRAWVLRLCRELGTPYSQVSPYLGVHHTAARAQLRKADTYWPDTDWAALADDLRWRILETGQ